MASVFEQRAAQAPQIVDETRSQSSGISPFQQRAQAVQQNDESWWKSAARKALQIPQGVAEVTGPGLWAGLWHMLALGETELGVDELQRLKDIGEREGKPFDEQAYEEARQNALSYIPTVSNIASGIEEHTGIPLEPKTRTERGIRFASSAGKIIPKPNPSAPLGYGFRGTNTALPRPILGAGVEAAKEIGVELGIPEPIADIASFGVVKSIPPGGNRLSIGRQTKPSGMTKRRYEELNEPFEVSKRTKDKINDKVENEFRQLTNEIIAESPIKETHQSLANDVTFKKNARERFKEVEALAETLPKEFDTSQIKNDLQGFIANKKNRGLTPSEFDKSHSKFINEYIRDTPQGKFTTKDIVAQYRKNNQQLSEAFEPGQSFAYNRAKREALLDYNRTLANMIEREFPGSEFSNLFKETNAKWAEISNSEAITKFLDNIFKEKINYTKARQLFDKEGMTVPFKKALGAEGFAKFERLLDDLLSTEKGMKYIKVAEQQGFHELAKMAGSYLLHPTLNKFHLGYKALKGGYNKIFEMLLDKPSIAIHWERGINAMKKGNFKAAEQEFRKVKTVEAVFDGQEAARTKARPEQPVTIEVEPVSSKSATQKSISSQANQMRLPAPEAKPRSSNVPSVVEKPKAEAAPKKSATLQLEDKSATQKRLEHKPQAKVIEQEAVKHPAVEKEPIFEDEGIQSIFDELLDEDTSPNKAEINKANAVELYEQALNQIREHRNKEKQIKINAIEEAAAAAEAKAKDMKERKHKRLAVKWQNTVQDLRAEIEKLQNADLTTSEAPKPKSAAEKKAAEAQAKKAEQVKKEADRKQQIEKEAKDEAARVERAAQREKEVALKEALPDLEADIQSEIKSLKEKRDSIQGRSQEAVKQRLPLTEKINKLELELHNSRKPFVKSPEQIAAEKKNAHLKQVPPHPKSETIKDFEIDILIANRELAAWRKTKQYNPAKLDNETIDRNIKRYQDVIRNARDKIFELREKEAENLSKKAKLAEEELLKSYEAVDKAKRELPISRDEKEASKTLKNALEEQKEAVLASRDANGAVIEAKLKIKGIEDEIRKLKIDYKKMKERGHEHLAIKRENKIAELNKELEELKEKITEPKESRKAEPIEIKNLSAIEALEENSQKVYDSFMEAHRDHGMNFSIEEGKSQLEKLNELIKLKKEEKKLAIKYEDMKKQKDIEQLIQSSENTKKVINEKLKELKSKEAYANADKKSSFSEDDIRSTMQEIVRLRKAKKSAKTAKEKNHLEKRIRELEKIYHENKKAAAAAAPDLRKYSKPEISKDALVRQRDFIVNEIEKALKNPPATQKLKIEVPGDGTFSIWNIEEVLEDFMKKIKKDWPVTQVGKSRGPSYPKVTERPERPISEYRSEGFLEGLWDKKEKGSIYK